MKSAAQTTLLIAFCCCALLPAAFAATSQDVSYKSGDETVHSLLFTPPGKGPFPGIVVIQEYWGLNDWVKEQASKLPTRDMQLWRLTCTAARWPILRTSLTN